MITRETLRDLSLYDGAGAPVASLYLDVDRARHTSVQVAERVHRLVAQARSDVTRRSYTADDLWAISEVLGKMEQFVRDQAWSTEKKGLVIFAASTLWRVVWLSRPVEDRIVLGRAPFIRPLVAMACEEQAGGEETLTKESVSLVNRLTAAVAHSYGVPDVEGALRALYERLVSMLVVDCRLTLPGSCCSQCGRLYSGSDKCPACGVSLPDREEDLFDAAIRAAYRCGARVATIRQDASWSGMGAFLRRPVKRVRNRPSWGQPSAFAAA